MSDAEDDYEDDGFEHYEFSAEKATKISSDHNTSSQMLKDASTAAKSKCGQIKNCIEHFISLHNS